MFFSEIFNVSRQDIIDYGAIDISLVCDTPFFIDPMLIFNSSKKDYKKIHDGIVKYFHFLCQKSKRGLSKKEINAWFNFSEVPNNWLGYSLSGNKGLALGKKYAEFLYNNIDFAISNNGITSGTHVEKVMLLYEGSGKDKISDLIVNLIKGFLCKYTEKFAKKFIDEKYCKLFFVDKVDFNYDTESFMSKEYYLPYVINEKGEEEYVILTPRDMLRVEEPAINRDKFIKSYQVVREAIDNEILRAYVNNYIAKAVNEYEKRQKKNKRTPNESTVRKIEESAFKELIKECPELYDYYIKIVESNSDEITRISDQEVESQINRLFVAAEKLVSVIKEADKKLDKSLSAREEAKNRLVFLKHNIENCDLYRNLYDEKGLPIAKEEDLQRLFKLVWYGTSFKVDSETNNGRGQTDFIVSFGKNNQNIVEFKLASNTKLSHVFRQVKIYELANESEGSLIAIFYFTEDEYKKAYKVVKKEGYEHCIDKSIFLIDCRNDNKPSASVV